MAQISVNDEYVVNGRLTVRRFKDEEDKIKIVGTFATHCYFEEILKLETFRYSITDIEGIEIQEEVFGSDDFDIVYNFTAKEIDNKYGLSDLNNDIIQKIENKMYGNQGYVLNTDLEGSMSNE